MSSKMRSLTKSAIETVLSEGHSRVEAAKILSVSPVTLRKAIRHYGIAMERRRKRHHAHGDEDEGQIRVSPELQAWFDDEGERLLHDFFCRLQYVSMRKADNA